ncbi:MAG: tetratricopeptide repeat protein [Deltaproteobacteria bacterium]|nr:tetratricopeptide repeat protein [Deltaproteobacteria bacterium]
MLSGLVLKFRVGSIPIRVEPGFWLLSAVLGWTGRGVADVLSWVGCVFVAVLCHELGHAIAARAYGGKPEVLLYAMGGLTFPKTPDSISRGAHVMISLAGPIAGFIFGGVVFVGAMFALTHAGAPWPERAREVFAVLGSENAPPVARAVKDLLWINLGWGAVNLFPVIPLDGGNVARMVLGSEEEGYIRALYVSVVVGPLVAVAAYLSGLVWAAMLFALFSMSAVRQLIDSISRRADRMAGHEENIKLATAALEAGDYEEASRLARPIAEGAKNAGLRYGATHVLAIALLELGRPQEALAAIKPVPPNQVDETLVGACLLAAGRAPEAVAHLETAARQGAGKHAWELLADALEKTGETERAAEARAQARSAGE